MVSIVHVRLPEPVRGNKRHDQRRPTAAQRGYDHAWRKARIEFLKYFPVCARCGAPATVVDYIIPHKGDDRLFWDKTNWQALCKPCHDRYKQREGLGFISAFHSDLDS